MFNMVRMLVEIMTEIMSEIMREIMSEIMSVFFLLVLRERAGFAQDVEESRDASEKWQSNQGGIRGIGV